MKRKSLRTLVCALFASLALTTFTFADSGPKPQLTVRVKDAPQEPYYLDLLAEGNWDASEGNSRLKQSTVITNSDGSETTVPLNEDLLALLLDNIPAGWHACTAQGSTGAPMWGDLAPDEGGLHTFGYHGVPETYRVLMVTKSGETFLSEVQTRRVLQSSVTVDWAAKGLSAAPVWVGYVLELLATLVPTLLLEGALLALLGLWNRRNLTVFLAANAATQLALFLLLGTTALKEGVGFGYFLRFLPLELVILLAETFAYRRFFTGTSKRRAAVYGISANLCSAVLGWFLAEPVWKFIVSIS